MANKKIVDKMFQCDQIRRALNSLKCAIGEFKLAEIDNVKHEFNQFETFVESKPLYSRKKINGIIEKESITLLMSFDNSGGDTYLQIDNEFKIIFSYIDSWVLKEKIKYFEYHSLKLTLNTLLDNLEQHILSSINRNIIVNSKETYESFNSLVLGGPGYGKTFFNKLRLKSSIKSGIKGILVIDEEKEFIEDYSSANMINELMIEGFKYLLYEIDGNYIITPENMGCQDEQLYRYFSNYDILSALKDLQINHIVADSDIMSLFLYNNITNLNENKIYCSFSLQCIIDEKEGLDYGLLLKISQGYIFSELSYKDQQIIDKESNELIRKRHSRKIMGNHEYRYTRIENLVFNLHRCEKIISHNKSNGTHLKVLSSLINGNWYHYIGRNPLVNEQMESNHVYINYCPYCGYQLK